ncbi:MAG: PEGA domain-containing protein [Chthoniobacter sp.]
MAKTDPPDTLVTLDERPAQRAPVRYGDLTPGRHRLFLTAKGYTTQTFDFLVTPGQTLDLGTIRLDRDIPAADSVKDNRFAGIWSGTRRTRMTMRFAFPVAGGLVRTQLATMTQPVSIEVSPDLASIRWHQDAITMQWEQAVYQNAPGNLDVDKDKPYTQTLQPPDKILGPFKPNITDKTLSFEVNDPSDSEHGGHLFVDLTPAPDGQTAECHYHHSIRFFASGAENSVEDEGFFTISRSTPGQKTFAVPVAAVTPNPVTPAPAAAITPAQLSAFCEKLQRDEQSQDLNRILANYDTKVDFDNLGRVGQAAIRTDKAKYFQRWPQTTYQIKADPELLETHNDRWKVRFLIDFTATNPAGERVTGVAEQTLDLVLRNGALKVITEKGRVITRDKTQLPAGSGPLPAVPPAAVAGRRFDGHGAVYKIPDLKNLVGKSLKNSWLYGDFDYQSYQGNVAVFVTANIIGAVGKGSTVVTMESPTPVFVRQETVNNRQQYFNQFGIWPEVIVRIVPNDPIELLSVTREASGRLVVRTRSPKPIQL